MGLTDLMLVYVPKEKVEAAYDCAAHLERRIEFARIWADDAPTGPIR